VVKVEKESDIFLIRQRHGELLRGKSTFFGTNHFFFTTTVL
jgi:hypothetical protein